MTTITGSRRSKAHFDLPLFLLVFGLAMFGVLAVSVATFSTSSEQEASILNYIVSSYYGMRQAIFLFISPIVVGVIVMVPYEFIRRNCMLFYFLACLLVFVTLVFNRAAGVKAWLDILWGYTIQPSEFVKLACIIVTAKYLESDYEPLTTLRSVGKLVVLMGIPCGLTLAQGETGSVIVMVFAFAIMMFFGGIPMRHAIAIVSLVVVAVGALLAVLLIGGSTDYRMVRILSFLDPSLDADASYQVTNSQMAIGSGGLHGKGTFVQGSFSQLDYVPEDWTDFIFSTIGEAFGFIGCALVLLVYLLIILRMLYLARYTSDRFGEMVIIGVMAMLVFHVVENVGMTTGLLPVTGIPLPFLSYGGSNLVTNMAGIGLVLNVVKGRTSTTIRTNSASHMHPTPQRQATYKWRR